MITYPLSIRKKECIQLDHELLLENIEDVETAILAEIEAFFGKKFIAEAWERLDTEGEGVIDFSEYLIYDFIAKDGTTVLKGIDERADTMNVPEEIMAMMKGSKLSAYEVYALAGKCFYKDIFTKVDFVVNTEDAGPAGMLFIGRLYPVASGYAPKLTGRYMPINHRESLLLGVMNRMKLDEDIHGRTDPGYFVSKNPELFYWFQQAIDHVEIINEVDEEELYQVYVSYYGFESRKAVKEKLITLEHLVLEEDDGATTVFSHRNDEGMLISEWVLTHNMLEVNAVSELHRKSGKDYLEMSLGNLVAHLHDKVENLDTIL